MDNKYVLNVVAEMPQHHGIQAVFDDEWFEIDFDFNPPPVNVNPDMIEFCKEHFQLHGSRFFAEKFNAPFIISDKSDWDFYTYGGQNMAGFLEENGFVKVLCNPEYFDITTEAIWYHPDHNGLQVVQKKLHKEYTHWLNTIGLLMYLTEFSKRHMANPDWLDTRTLIRNNLNNWIMQHFNL